MYKSSSKKLGGSKWTPYVRKQGDHKEADNFGSLPIIRETPKAFLFNFYMDDDARRAVWVPKSVCEVQNEHVYLQRWWHTDKKNEKTFNGILKLEERVKKIVKITKHKE